MNKYIVTIINSIMSPFYYIEKDEWRGSGYRGGWDRGSSAYGALINALIFIIGVAISQAFYGGMLDYMPAWKFYANGFLLLVLSILAGASIIYGCKLIAKIIPAKEEKEEKEETYEEAIAREQKERELYYLKEQRRKKSFWYLMKKMFVAWKDKNCPIIEWNK